MNTAVTVSIAKTAARPIAPNSSIPALLSYGVKSARASASTRRGRGELIGASVTSSSPSMRPTGLPSSNVTEVKRSSMHGPASDGATMSASEVMRVFGMTFPDLLGHRRSKIVSSSGTSSETARTMSAKRSTIASSRSTTATESTSSPSSASRTSSSSGCAQADHAGAAAPRARAPSRR